MATNPQALSFRAITIILLCSWYLPSFGQHSSLQNANKKTIIRYFDEVINTQKLNRRAEFFSSDFIWHQTNGTDVRGSQDSSHVAMKRWLFTAIPDVHYAIDQVIAEGDIVAVNTTATGTAKSEMFGLPAGQKKVRYKQMFFFRLKNNKITEQWEVVDQAGIYAQLEQK